MSTTQCSAWIQFDRMPTRFECKERYDHGGDHADYASVEDPSARPDGYRVIWEVSWQDDAMEHAACTTGYDDPLPTKGESRG